MLKTVLFVLMLTPMFGYTTRLDDYIKTACRSKCTDRDRIIDASNVAAYSLGVDSSLILSVIEVESTYNKKAKNGSSVGLMQVNLYYHRKKFKGDDPYDIFANIFVGTSILKDCLVRHKGVLKKALTCYNGGGTTGYADKVLKLLPLVRNRNVLDA